MKIQEYFLNYKALAYDKLQFDASYNETIENFYEVFIREHLKKFFVDHKSNLLNWCALLEKYANDALPIFWIRRFESGGQDVNDNRRTGTTVLVDKSKTAVAAYAYISNYDVQELYNMVLSVDDPGDFEALMMEGEYKFHFDNGEKSNESAITSFQCLAHAKTPGTFNAAHLYLAHIVDVNGEYPATPHVFEKGDISDWKEVAAYTGHNFLHIFSGDSTKKVRVQEYTDDITCLKDFLKAHFFRFVHPFNYYLVPGQNYEINGVFGKTKRSVGEYSDLTNYVRYRMYKDFIKDDVALNRCYAAFEDTIQIDDSRKLSKNFPDLEAESKDLGKSILHIVYGASVGEEGKILRKLSKIVTNVHDLQDFYNKKYTPGDRVVYYDLTGTTVLKSFGPHMTSDATFADFLERLWSHKPNAKTKVKIDIEKATSTAKRSKTSGTKTGTKKTGTAVRRYADDVRIEVAEYYLEHTTGLPAVEKAILGRSSNGSTAKTWLNEMGIETDGKYKGLLCKEGVTLDDEIAKATDPEFKDTLEAIKSLKASRKTGHI